MRCIQDPDVAEFGGLRRRSSVTVEILYIVYLICQDPDVILKTINARSKAARRRIPNTASLRRHVCGSTTRPGRHLRRRIPNTAKFHERIHSVKKVENFCVSRWKNPKLDPYACDVRRIPYTGSPVITPVWLTTSPTKSKSKSKRWRFSIYCIRCFHRYSSGQSKRRAYWYSVYRILAAGSMSGSSEPRRTGHPRPRRTCTKYYFSQKAVQPSPRCGSSGHPIQYTRSDTSSVRDSPQGQQLCSNMITIYCIRDGPPANSVELCVVSIS